MLGADKSNSELFSGCEWVSQVAYGEIRLGYLNLVRQQGALKAVLANGWRITREPVVTVGFFCD